MTQYYAAIIRATRDSARAVRRMQVTYRMIRDAVTAHDHTAHERALQAHERAHRAYARAQEILASHPLSAADIAARQASYPKPRD